jgi:deoxyribose-phosphate aldolase
MAEAELALAQGARELDMVQNIGALHSGDYAAVRDEIAGLASLCHSRGAILKVILETCLLSDEQKERSCQLAVEAQADFVKTSTGFAAKGATAADVTLMRRAVPGHVGVKASGGIRSFSYLNEMVQAGANRIGTSSGVKIVGELTSQSVTTEPLHINAVRLPGGNPDTY